MRIAIAALLLLISPLLLAEEKPKDIVELSPDLYLLLYTSRVESLVDIKMNAITEANEFAAKRGGVAVPVAGQYSALGFNLKMYEYQFRVMSREQALASRPTLADAVITVNNTGQCAPNAAVTAALQTLSSPDELRLIATRLPLPGGMALPMPPPDDSTTSSPNNGPGTICLPGQICNPAQICLPGWQCNPGAPPTPEPPTPPPGSTAQ